jgi:hypothetical protein
LVGVEGGEFHAELAERGEACGDGVVDGFFEGVEGGEEAVEVFAGVRGDELVGGPGGFDLGGEGFGVGEGGFGIMDLGAEEGFGFGDLVVDIEDGGGDAGDVEEGVPVDLGVLEFAEGVAELGVGEELGDGALFGVPIGGGEDGRVSGGGHGGPFREWG